MIRLGDKIIALNDYSFLWCITDYFDSIVLFATPDDELENVEEFMLKYQGIKVCRPSHLLDFFDDNVNDFDSAVEVYETIDFDELCILEDGQYGVLTYE